MKNIIIILGILLQLFYIWGLLIVTISIYNVVGQFEEIREVGVGDPKIIAGALSQIIVSFVIKAIIGLIGLVISWRILVKYKDNPEWFKGITKTLSYLWLIFIPIGTVLAVIQLKHLKNET